MPLTLSKQSFFHFVFATNALLYSLVYFYPLNEIGEPQISIYLKLAFDFILAITILLFGFRIKFNQTQMYGLGFLVVVLVFGALHIHHTSLTEYLHFSVRNIFFYSLFLFVNYFPKIEVKKFKVFHERLFNFILYFGLILFLFQKSGIENPFGFHEWMWEKNRLITTWLNPNSLGFYLIFYLFYFFFEKNKVTPYLGLIAGSIFLTGSLTAIIGVIFFSGFLFVRYISSRQIRITHIIIVSAAIPFFVYLIISLGALDYILFKIDVLFVQKDKIYTSVSTRIQNLHDLIEYFSFNNIPSIIFGDFESTVYRRLDSQYLNVLYNYGLIGLFLYLIFQVAILIELFKNPSTYSKAFMFFSFWLYIVAFNLTAYMYRSNLVVFYYIMLAYTLSLSKEQNYLEKDKNGQ